MISLVHCVHFSSANHSKTIVLDLTENSACCLNITLSTCVAGGYTGRNFIPRHAAKVSKTKKKTDNRLSDRSKEYCIKIEFIFAIFRYFVLFRHGSPVSPRELLSGVPRLLCRGAVIQELFS